MATTLTVTLYYGANEELGEAYYLNAFTGDAATLARTALDDTPPSDNLPAHWMRHSRGT